jgi:hypothetical protein
MPTHKHMPSAQTVDEGGAVNPGRRELLKAGAVALSASVAAPGVFAQSVSAARMPRLKITVGGKEFTAILRDNAAARALVSKLPLTLEMSDLNGNEKYHHFKDNLTAELPSSPGTINAGDIMCYASNALGAASVQVTFSIGQQNHHEPG